MGTQPNDPTAQPGPAPAAAQTGMPPAAAEPVDAPELIDPTDAEIEAWAERVGKRRKAELQVEEQDAKTRERMRLRQRYLREAQLAAEGAVSLIFKWWSERLT